MGEPHKNGGWSVKWTAGEIIPVDFREPFHVFAKGSSYFFLTESGRLYIAKKPEKGERKLEPIWTDKDKPIVAIIDDQDRGKVFLFGKEKRAIINAQDFYFELDEKPRVKEFSPFDLKPVKHAEPLKTLLPYVNLLAEKEKK